MPSSSLKVLSVLESVQSYSRITVERFGQKMMKYYYCSQSAYCIVLLSMFIIVNRGFQLGLDDEPASLAYNTKRRDARTCIKIASMFEQPSCTNFCHLFSSLTNITEKMLFQSCGFFLSCKNCTFNEGKFSSRQKTAVTPVLFASDLIFFF